MSINGGTSVRYPCPFLWQLEPLKVVLYPLGMEPETQTMLVQLLYDDRTMIFRHAKDVTLVLPPNKTHDFWFKANRTSLMAEPSKGGKLKFPEAGPSVSAKSSGCKRSKRCSRATT